MMSSRVSQGMSVDTVAHTLYRVGSRGSSHEEPNQTEIGLQTVTRPDLTISSWVSQGVFVGALPHTAHVSEGSWLWATTEMQSHLQLHTSSGLADEIISCA